MLQQFWLDTYGASAPMLPQGAFPLPMDGKLLAKAQPDECFDGIGNPYPPGPPCASGAPKVNQAYVWGLTKVADTLWFGTAPNVHCLVFGIYLGINLPHETHSWTCEFGESQVTQLGIPAPLGDWRAPDIFTYDTATQSLVEKTPVDLRLNRTLGLRSAGNLNNVVFMGGPDLLGGVNLFAFQGDTGAYLGSTSLPGYNNIRKWLVVNEVLYVGMGNTTGGGSVLRWRGDAANPFQFETVGALDGDAAELAAHNGRIFVSTWPNPIGATVSGVWMSPVVPADGLSAADAAGWRRLWQASDYDPDLLTAMSYGGGALASFDGYLYWGTMHVPFAATLLHIDQYGLPSETKELLAAVLGTQRAISIFRGRDLDTAHPKIELVYGNPILPAYTLADGWKLAPNKMGQMPRFGLSGLGNFFNNYTWSMNVYRGQLFIGTMDWSYLLSSALQTLLASLDIGDPETVAKLVAFPGHLYGADLFRIPAAQHLAVPVSIAGVGNFTNYGVRNMLSDDALYLGMANPMNLLTDPHDQMPEGGWELIGLYKLPDPPIYGWVFLDINGDGIRQDTEQAGVADVRLSLEQYGAPSEQAKSAGSDGWYQYDYVGWGHLALKATIPAGYVATSLTTVPLTRLPHSPSKVISFGVQKARGAIGDRVWNDIDANGQQDAGEAGIGNVVITLLEDNAGAPGTPIRLATTNAQGEYLFDWLAPGTYWVQVTDQNNALSGMTITTGPESRTNPYGPITVAHLAQRRDADFGYTWLPDPTQAVIAQDVWRDLNGNGRREAHEPGIGGVMVCASPLGHTQVICAFSDGNGKYGIIVPSGRTYIVTVTSRPAGTLATTTEAYLPVVVHPGERLLDKNFGYR